MNKDTYKALRSQKTSDYDFLHKYFLESGGSRVNSIQFVMKFQQWCMMNTWDMNSVIKQIKERFDKKYEYGI
jgi:hypothetical protein